MYSRQGADSESADSKMFKGKVVIVTGSSTGIGAGAAAKFAELGAAAVTIHGRQEDALKKTKERIEKASNGQTKVHVVTGDITKETVRQKLILETVDKFGKLDVLVNNVGWTAPPMPMTDVPIEDFDKIFDVNLRSMVVLTQLAIPHLVKSKGNIINISSVGGIKALPIFAYYGMAKAAMDHYTRCLAVELGPKGVRVNSVNPGSIPDTAFAANAGADAKRVEENNKMMNAITPLRRPGKTEEVVELIAFLASDKAAFITGTRSIVDGGIVLG